MRIWRWKRRPSLRESGSVNDERIHHPYDAWNASKPGINALFAHGCCQSEICSLYSHDSRRQQRIQLLVAGGRSYLYTVLRYDSTTLGNRIKKYSDYIFTTVLQYFVYTMLHSAVILSNHIQKRAHTTTLREGTQNWNHVLTSTIRCLRNLLVVSQKKTLWSR